MCNSRFHFIIPAEATLEDPSSLMALVEGKFRGTIPLDVRWQPPPPAQEAGAAGDDAGGTPGAAAEGGGDGEGGGDAGSAYNAAESVFEAKDHLLHGMLHLNGYGHLLRMNGSQGGSRRLIGERGV